MAKLTARLKSVSRAIAKPHPGFLTISSNVFCGENKTPTMRLIALIWGCDSGAAGETAVVVAIGRSSTTRLGITLCLDFTQGPTQIFQCADSSLFGARLSVSSACRSVLDPGGLGH